MMKEEIPSQQRYVGFDGIIMTSTSNRQLRYPFIRVTVYNKLCYKCRMCQSHQPWLLLRWRRRSNFAIVAGNGKRNVITVIP